MAASLPGLPELHSIQSRDGSRSNTQFGIGYEVWWNTIVNWTSPEAIPTLGQYSSYDPVILEQHAS